MATSATPSMSGEIPRSPGAAAASPRPSAKSTTDPVLRNALRYTISAREYGLLHRYVLSRSRAIKKRVPTVDAVQRIMDGRPNSRARAQEMDTAKGRTKQKSRDVDRAEGSVLSIPEGHEGSVPGDDYNARAIRHSIRVFVATGALMKTWGIVSARLMGSGKQE